MDNFKTFIKEMAVPPDGYTLPTDRTKFALGDIVIVIPTSNWKTYQSKRSSVYFNKAGTVIGYKNVPGAYSKFALEFPDGAVEAYHGHFLYGPFKDITTAEKYNSSNINNIDPNDYAQKAGTTLRSEPQTHQGLEQLLQQTFVNDIYKFQWLSTPLQFQDSNNKITVLGVCPLNKHKDFIKLCNDDVLGSIKGESQYFINHKASDYSQFDKLFSNNFLIFRNNSTKNNALKNNHQNSYHPFLACEFDTFIKSPYSVTFFTTLHFYGNPQMLKNINKFNYNELKQVVKEHIYTDCISLNAKRCKQIQGTAESNNILLELNNIEKQVSTDTSDIFKDFMSEL